MGERKEAEACYRRALRYAPNPGSAHFDLGIVFEDQEEKQEAIYASEEALRRNPNFRDAHCNLAQLYEQLGRRQDAVTPLCGGQATARDFALAMAINSRRVYPDRSVPFDKY